MWNGNITSHQLLHWLEIGPPLYDLRLRLCAQPRHLSAFQSPRSTCGKKPGCLAYSILGSYSLPIDKSLEQDLSYCSREVCWLQVQSSVQFHGKYSHPWVPQNAMWHWNNHHTCSMISGWIVQQEPLGTQHTVSVPSIFSKHWETRSISSRVSCGSQTIPS